MNASDARLQLLAQHDRIRQHLERCTRLAAQQRARPDEPVSEELDEALAGLRDEFVEHNQVETEIIASLLKGPAAWSSLMVDRMLEEHVGEHAAFWELLSGTRDEVSERIAELAEQLDAHMAAEERTFLSPMTLREDILRTRTRELENDP